MTAKGTLYIDEDCRDWFEKELDGWFGKDLWTLDGGNFGDCWDLSQFPSVVEVEVNDMETDEVIGKVEITSNSYIEDMGAGEFISKEPKSIKLIWIKDELKDLVRQKIEQIKNEK